MSSRASAYNLSTASRLFSSRLGSEPQPATRASTSGANSAQWRRGLKKLIDRCRRRRWRQQLPGADGKPKILMSDPQEFAEPDDEAHEWRETTIDASTHG